ncbi:MAG: hypothetical protein U0168_00795 [Nannocystaceae bacterium]
MEQLADKGNGNYAYIDLLAEAQGVGRRGRLDLVTIAKDVEDPGRVQPQGGRCTAWSATRTASWAHRLQRRQQGRGRDRAGHSVTALYEVAGSGRGRSSGVDHPLKYQDTARSLSPAADRAS